MRPDIFKNTLEQGLRGTVANRTRALLSLTATTVGVAFGTAPTTAAAGFNGCSTIPKSYEQTLSFDELNALAATDSSMPANQQERARITNGVSKAGLTPGSEVIVGAGVNRSATDIPYPVLNSVVYSVLTDSGYTIGGIAKLRLDSGAAGILKIDQKSTKDCRIEV